ncbi:MAG: serine hydrolase [Elusimicrobia bacterium]|nr:serine hydrolase [Elusimicrobiota bacterium]
MRFRPAVVLHVFLFFFLAQNGETKPSKIQIHGGEGDARWQWLGKKVQYQVHHFPGQPGVFIKDMRRGWTIECNADQDFPSASLIKIPIMMVLYKAQAEGKISLEEELAIQKNEKSRGSGALKHERVGTKHTVRDLIERMITESDNTATNMLTQTLGLNYYNAQFAQLGLKETNFARKIMDLRKRDQGIENYTTPKEMGYLLEMIYRKKVAHADEMLNILKKQKINDRLSVAIPPPWEIGHKTGLLRNTCHDVGVVFTPSNDYIICVLTSGVRNIRRAKSFISEISHLSTVYYRELTPQTADEKSVWPQTEKEPSSISPDSDSGKSGG